jgi:hypothetical protein
MKITRDNQGSMVVARCGVAAAGALLVSLVGLGVVASTGHAIVGDEILVGNDDGEGGPDVTVSGFGRFQPDEEAVGTLPTRDDDDDDDDDLMGPEALPSFYVEGPRSEVFGCFVAMSGEGFVDIDSVDTDANGGGGSTSGPQKVRVTFHGQVRLTFDGSFFSASQVTAGITSHQALGTTIASAMTEDDLLMVAEVPAGIGLSVPIGSFDNHGLLSDGVHVITSNRIRGRDYIGVSGCGGLIEVWQGMPIQ